jgi:hypothetical protein
VESKPGIITSTLILRVPSSEDGVGWGALRSDPDTARNIGQGWKGALLSRTHGLNGN